MKNRLTVATALVFVLSAVSLQAQEQKSSTASSNDDRIDYQLRVKLAGDPDVKGGALDVTVKDGVVTLKGRVDTDKGKVKAGKIAKKIKGVKDVDNEIDVGPPK